MTQDLSDNLKLVRGGARDLQLYLLAEDALPEPLADCTGGTLRVSLDDSQPAVITKALVVDHDLGCLKCTLTGGDTGAAPTGLLIAEIEAVFSGTTYKSTRFTVDIAEGLS